MSTKYIVTLEYKITVEADSREEAETKAIDKVMDITDCPNNAFIRESEDNE